MKRLFIMLLVAVMCFCGVGCTELLGGTTPDTEVSTEQNTVTPSATLPNHTHGVPSSTPDVTDTFEDVTADFDDDARLLRISYLDVGQGDSIFMVLPNGKTMLIDASISSKSDEIINYIKAGGYTAIDYVVATHPHADHIGGMTAVLDEFEIGVMFMPDVTTNTKTFESMLDKLEEKEIAVKRAKAGVTVCEEEDFSVKILAPNKDEYSDLNDYSAVVRVVYRSRAFMFMGDAHVESEEEITADVSCDVIKVGHHGSRTSSGESFVNKTGAKYAVFSLGEGNDYGHPHAESVERWQKSGAKILRTDVLGNIVAITDGDKLAIATNSGNVTDPSGTPTPDAPTTPTSSPEPTETEYGGEEKYNWVLNVSSKKIHREGCSSIKNMNESNKAYSNESMAELEAKGYTGCKICHPEDLS